MCDQCKKPDTCDKDCVNCRQVCNKRKYFSLCPKCKNKCDLKWDVCHNIDGELTEIEVKPEAIVQ